MRVILSITLLAISICTQLLADESPQARAHRVLASELDSSLPTIPIGSWLANVVKADRELQWTGTGCPASQEYVKVPPVNPPVCVLVTASRRPGPERPQHAAAKGAVVAVSIRLGTGNPYDGPWQLERPQVEDAFMERDGDSLNVPQLRDLPRLLALPVEQWPKADLSVFPEDIRCNRTMPKPGEHVTCEATIHNRGAIDAVARITAGLIEAGSHMGTTAEQFRQSVPSKGRVVVSWDWVWPQGRAWNLQVWAELHTRHAGGGYRLPVKEPNLRNNRAHVKVSAAK